MILNNIYKVNEAHVELIFKDGKDSIRVNLRTDGTNLFGDYDIAPNTGILPIDFTPWDIFHELVKDQIDYYEDDDIITPSVFNSFSPKDMFQFIDSLTSVLEVAINTYRGTDIHQNAKDIVDLWKMEFEGKDQGKFTYPIK